MAVDDVRLVVKVQHVDGAEFPGGAARLGAVGRRDLLEVGVRVLLERHKGTVAGTVVGLVLFRGDNKVPAELLKVHLQRIAAAEVLVHVVIAIVNHAAPGAMPGLHRRDVHERGLQTKSIRF